ncbi:MAG TPA: RDD family protein [Edaphobacter sp.]|nr:RDD family protein [Edaphobacter sp.]
MSAERKLDTEDGAIVTAEAAPEAHALRQQVAERLAAHRSRRPRGSEQIEPQAANPRQRASKIAAAVAERYAQTKSYQAYLAEEAERAVREAEEAARQAQAAAEIAARNAEAMAKAQYELLTELEEYRQPEPTVDARQHAPTPASQRTRAQWTVEEPELEFETPAAPAEPPLYTVRHVADLRLPAQNESAVLRRSQSEAEVEEAVDPTDAYSLDEEIVFRQDPVFEPVEPPTPIPGNIIEFPRELIAPRKARPRLAEGPLLDEPVHSDPSLLRIFEVEAEQISNEPALDAAAPEWTSILLDAHPRQAGSYGVQAQRPSAAYAEASYAPENNSYAAQHLQLSPETEHLYSTPLEVAPVSLRLMSAMVDLCIVIAAFVVFAGVAVKTTSHLIPGGIQMGVPTAAISTAGSIVLLGLLYQILFFTFSDATPGMRYARIGLCTMTDENPTRAAMRRRILALVLSSASLGMGVLWALLDDERLGWHDRISRMYQRSY